MCYFIMNVVVNLFIDFIFHVHPDTKCDWIREAGTLWNTVFDQRNVSCWNFSQKPHFPWCSFTLRDRIANFPEAFPNDNINSTATERRSFYQFICWILSHIHRYLYTVQWTQHTKNHRDDKGEWNSLSNSHSSRGLIKYWILRNYMPTKKFNSILPNNF